MFRLLPAPSQWTLELDVSKNMNTGIRNLLVNLVHITIFWWWWWRRWWCWWRRSWFLQQITTLGFFHDFILTLLLWIIFFQNVFKNHCKRWFIYFSWRSLFNSTGFSPSMFEIAFSRETYSLLVSDIFRRIFLHVFNALLMRQADSFIVLYNFSISLYLSSTIVSLPYF